MQTPIQICRFTENNIKEMQVVKLKLRFIQSFCKGFLAIALLCSASFANAVIIESELTSLGGDSYQFDFNVINDDLAAGIEEFSVYFDELLYENLSVIASPVDWDSIVVQPDPGLPDVGFFDSLFFVDPIAEGSALDGFSVAFDWLGAAAGPAAFGNAFDIFDANFAIVASGVTTAPVVVPPPPNPIPEPGILSLFGLALLFVGARKRFS